MIYESPETEANEKIMAIKSFIILKSPANDAANALYRRNVGLQLKYSMQIFKFCAPHSTIPNNTITIKCLHNCLNCKLYLFTHHLFLIQCKHSFSGKELQIKLKLTLKIKRIINSVVSFYSVI